jgi:hypothetical protein
MAGCDTINPLALADLVVGGPLLSLQNFGKLPGTYWNIAWFGDRRLPGKREENKMRSGAIV